MKKLLLILFVLCAVTVSAAEGKRGFVNMEKVFNEYYKTITENIAIETQIKKFNDELELLRNEYANSVNEFRKAQSEAGNELLSADARSAARGKADMLAQRLQQKQSEINNFRQRGSMEIQDKQQAQVEKLVADLTAQVKKYAADNGYTEVMETSGRSTNRVPLFLVYPSEQDITDQVIKVTNAGHEKEKTNAQAQLAELRKKMAAELEARRAAAQGMLQQ